MNAPTVVPLVIVSEVGTASPALLDLRTTIESPLEGAVSDTAQPPRPPGVTLVGEQKTMDIAGGAADKVKVADTPSEPMEARTVAAWVALRGPLETVKVADVTPAGIMTEAGAVKMDGALVETATLKPPAGAFLESVTPQTVLVLDVSVVSEHCSALTVIGELSVSANDALAPPRLAVTVIT